MNEAIGQNNIGYGRVGGFFCGKVFHVFLSYFVTGYAGHAVNAPVTVKLSYGSLCDDGPQVLPRWQLNNKPDF